MSFRIAQPFQKRSQAVLVWRSRVQIGKCKILDAFVPQRRYRNRLCAVVVRLSTRRIIALNTPDILRRQNCRQLLKRLVVNHALEYLHRLRGRATHAQSFLGRWHVSHAVWTSLYLIVDRAVTSPLLVFDADAAVSSDQHAGLMDSGVPVIDSLLEPNHVRTGERLVDRPRRCWLA